MDGADNASTLFFRAKLEARAENFASPCLNLCHVKRRGIKHWKIGEEKWYLAAQM